MGVLISMSKPIRININAISECTNESIVVDSTQFNNNSKFVEKACLELANNKKVKKLVFKLEFAYKNLTKFSLALAKTLKNRESVSFYGSGLFFFEYPLWKSVWESASIESLSIKEKLSNISFSTFCQGLKCNKAIKELTLRLLNESECNELSLALKDNTSIKTINFQAESRSSNADDLASSLSSAPSTSHSRHIFSPILSENTSITTYSLSGYIEVFPLFILGLIKNRSVNKFILENLELYNSISVWPEVFRQNHSIKQLEIKRGCNTSTAMILFTSLRASRTLISLKIHECTFSEGGFMTLRDCLALNQGLQKLEIKDLLQLKRNSQEPKSCVNNFLHVLSGLTDSRTLEEAVIIIRQNLSSAGVFVGFEVRSALNALASQCNSLRLLKIEGFRLGGSEILGICEGLRGKPTLSHVILTENLIEWKDLIMIINELQYSEGLELFDITENKIYSHSNLISLKGHAIAEENLVCMHEVFEAWTRLKKFELKITDWFWQLNSYPASLHQAIQKAHNVIY